MTVSQKKDWRRGGYFSRESIKAFVIYRNWSRAYTMIIKSGSSGRNT